MSTSLPKSRSTAASAAPNEWKSVGQERKKKVTTISKRHARNSLPPTNKDRGYVPKRYVHARWDELEDADGNLLFERGATYTRFEVFGKGVCSYLEKGKFCCAEQLADAKSQLCVVHRAKWIGGLGKRAKKNISSPPPPPKTQSEQAKTAQTDHDTGFEESAVHAVVASARDDTVVFEEQNQKEEQQEKQQTQQTRKKQQKKKRQTQRTQQTQQPQKPQQRKQPQSVDMMGCQQNIDELHEACLNLDALRLENKLLSEMLAESRAQTRALFCQLNALKWIQQQQAFANSRVQPIANRQEPSFWRAESRLPNLLWPAAAAQPQQQHQDQHQQQQQHAGQFYANAATLQQTFK